VNISSNTTITATFVAPTTPTLSGDCAPTNVRCVGPGQEYATVQACAAVAQPGDTCLVYPGVYSERVNVNRDGVSGSPITFAAKGVVTVCGFDFTNSDYVRVIGFVLDTNAGSCTISYANVNISGTNNYLEFWDNVFRDALYNGIRLGVNDFINNSVVVGNTFSNFGVVSTAWNDGSA
jgi:pectin methylesterase-like acyl-CoA thioesterase